MQKIWGIQGKTCQTKAERQAAWQRFRRVAAESGEWASRGMYVHTYVVGMRARKNVGRPKTAAQQRAQRPNQTSKSSAKDEVGACASGGGGGGGCHLRSQRIGKRHNEKA